MSSKSCCYRDVRLLATGSIWFPLMLIVAAQAADELDPWATVDQQIAEQEPSLDPGANMKVALEMLVKIDASGSLRRSNREIVEVLRKFEIIDHYVSRPRCNDQGNEMRDYLARLVLGSKNDRLIKIVEHYSRKLAQVCQPQYAKMYAKREPQDEPILEPMHLFLAEHVASTLVSAGTTTANSTTTNRHKRVLSADNSNYWRL